MSKLWTLLKSWLAKLWPKPAPAPAPEPTPAPEPQGDPEMSKPQPDEYPSTVVVRVSSTNKDRNIVNVVLESPYPLKVDGGVFRKQSNRDFICNASYERGVFTSGIGYWDFEAVGTYFVEWKSGVVTYQTQPLLKFGKYNEPEVRPANM